jgi:cathepsin B
MFKLTIVGTIVALAAATPINHDMVQSIRAKATWQAHDVEANPLKNYTHDELLKMLGTFIVPTNGVYKKVEVTATPAEFDARTQWPSYVHAVRDQQQCGSCWAFGASESLSDRFAISSAGKVNKVLSPEDLVSCDSSDYGCGGGYMENAWVYLENTGIVTDTCFPYTSGDGTEAPCQTKCTDGSAWTKYKCQAGTRVNPQTVDEIKSELYNHGPMEGAFTVYEDFFNYKSGVYTPTSTSVAGGHAIKVLGYGTESGKKYWLCANSWGSGWGMDGFFKIEQGTCDIDTQIFSCTPDVASVSL